MNEDREPATLPGSIAVWWPFGLCLGFLLGLIALEGLALHAIAEPGTHHAGIAWRLLVPIGFLAVALLLPRRGRWLVLGASGVAWAAIVAGDLAYHEYFGTVTSAFMLSSIAQLAAVDGSVRELLSWQSLIPVALFLPYLALALRPDLLAPGRDREASGRTAFGPARKAGAALLGLEALLVIAALNVPIFEETHHLGRSPWVRPADHWGSRYSRLSHAATFGLFNYHIADLRDYLLERFDDSPIEEQARAEVHATLARKKQLNDESSPLFGIARGRHVVLLQLESLQHFLLDIEVSGHEVMPNLDRLKRGGLSSDYILDVTHIGRTSDAEFAVLTGLYPDVRKPIAAYRIPTDMVTLPKELGKAGYRSSSIHGFKRSFWNRAYSHPAYGIDEMYFEEAFDDSDLIGLGPSDRQVFRFAADLLASRRSRPQLLFVISLSSHHPYLSVPVEWMKPYAALAPDEGFGLLAPYLGSASYTDSAVGAFVDHLASLDLLEDCLIVIYGDHDRGGLGEQRPIPEVGDRMFGPAEDRVPFVVLVPGEEERLGVHQAKFRNVMGGLVDLMPTVLHLLGEQTPRGIVGTNLLIENERRDPIPLPGSPGLFGYRGALALGNGRLLRSKGAVVELGPIPSPESALRDRIVSERLIDHHAELIAGDAETSPRAQD